MFIKSDRTDSDETTYSRKYEIKSPFLRREVGVEWSENLCGEGKDKFKYQ